MKTVSLIGCFLFLSDKKLIKNSAQIAEMGFELTAGEI